jgi:CMP/dCMP kinase
MTEGFTICFDGTSASGKGSISRRVAERYGAAYLDTGKLYRAMAFLFKSKKIAGNYADEASRIFLEFDEALLESDLLLDESLGVLASEISKDSKVRVVLLDFQRDFINQNSKIVLDGRDTGSVICPDADLKFFIDADVRVRAQRRTEQLQEKKSNLRLDYEEILDSLMQRDFNDKNRNISPLVISEGAFVIDNSMMHLDILLKKIFELIDSFVHQA